MPRIGARETMRRTAPGKKNGESRLLDRQASWKSREQNTRSTRGTRSRWLSCASCASCVPFLLVCPGEDHAAFRSAAALDAFALFGVRVSGNISNGRFGLILDLLFAFSGTAPMTPEESALAVQYFVELRVLVDAIAMRFAKRFSPFEHRLLNVVQHVADGFRQAVL